MKLLIVDDDQNNRMTLQLLLEDVDNIDISEAKDGKEAIELCKKDHYDIIFMDIMMPNIDGISATRIIKSFDKKVMILALSALDDEESKNSMLACGAEDYITKPIEENLFYQRVKNYMQIVELRNKKPVNVDAINLFTQEVYSRSLKFCINSLQSLAELWDYYLNEPSYSIEGVEDCIRLIYAFGQLNLKNNTPFSIIAEENEDNLFLTCSHLETIRNITLQNILLKNYKNGIFILDHNILSFRLPKGKSLRKEEVEKLNITEYTKSILSITHFDKTPASEYVESTPISLMAMIENLECIRDKIEVIAIEFEKHPTKENLLKITEYIAMYIDVINHLMEFEHFAYALKVLNEFLIALDPKELSTSDLQKFSLLFLSLLDDIEGWRYKIFISVEANDIHYFDSSLLSSCLQIRSLLLKEEISDNDDDEFELF